MASLFTMFIASILGPTQATEDDSAPYDQSQLQRTPYMELPYNQEQALQQLSEQLNYDPKSGEFTWKMGGKGRTLGRPAGAYDHNGYLKFSTTVSNKRIDVKAQRLAVFIMSLENRCAPLQGNTKVGFANGNRADLSWNNLQIFQQ